MKKMPQTFTMDQRLIEALTVEAERLGVFKISIVEEALAARLDVKMPVPSSIPLDEAARRLGKVNWRALLEGV